VLLVLVIWRLFFIGSFGFQSQLLLHPKQFNAAFRFQLPILPRFRFRADACNARVFQYLTTPSVRQMNIPPKSVLVVFDHSFRSTLWRRYVRQHPRKHDNKPDKWFTQIEVEALSGIEWIITGRLLNHIIFLGNCAGCSWWVCHEIW
jgi:hypothetical protein